MKNPEVNELCYWQLKHLHPHINKQHTWSFTTLCTSNGDHSLGIQEQTEQMRHRDHLPPIWVPFRKSVTMTRHYLAKNEVTTLLPAGKWGKLLSVIQQYMYSDFKRNLYIKHKKIYIHKNVSVDLFLVYITLLVAKSHHTYSRHAANYTYH